MHIPKRCTNLLQYFKLFVKYKKVLKKTRLDLCRTAVLCYCNRPLIGLNLNFHTILTYRRYFGGKRYAPLCFIWNFFSNVKKVVKELRLNSYRTDDSYYCNKLLMESFLNFDKILRHFLCKKLRHLLCKVFPFYCCVWNFFENTKGALKQVRVILCRADILHHYNRL